MSRPHVVVRISGRRLFWALATLLGTVLFGALALIAWDIVDTQRIWSVIEANEGWTELSPNSMTLGDSYVVDNLIMGRPLCRHQVVKVTVGFNPKSGGIDFSRPLRPGEPHPLAVLERLPNLKRLSVHSSRISAEGTSCIACCRCLSSLYLAAREFHGNEMRPLASLTGLRQLGLESDFLGGPAVAPLQALPALESLRINHARIDDRAMQELSRLRGLRELDLFCVTFDPASMEHLAELTCLEWLSVRAEGMTHIGYHHLGRLKGLRTLAVAGCNVWNGEIGLPVIDQNVAELANLTELRKLYLESGKITGASVKTLLRLANLETLEIQVGDLTDDEVIRLVTGLNVTSFSIYSPKFEDPARICKQVAHPRLYFYQFPPAHVDQRHPGYVVTTTEPR